jgi:tRNA dimethylallyltransferase
VKAPAAYVLLGPTASGKSVLALELAARFPLEIVSVDSGQVYRGMDIGTAKPTREVLDEVPHHLIDVCDPTERYSAGRFRRDAELLIAEIRSRGKVPLLAGGTMLYFRALTGGLAPLPEARPDIRARIDRRAAEAGWPALHAELATRDPQAAAKIQPNDGQRIQRALEVLEITGMPISGLQATGTPSSLQFEQFALLTVERTELYRRIDSRFLDMMNHGFLAEVERLRGRGDLDPDLPSLRAVGYRQLWAHLEGACGLQEAVAAGQRATRQLAKRQLTWLRAESPVTWVRGLEDGDLEPIRRALDHSAPR